MPNVQVRDVPEEVHAAPVRQAELAGQSLQQYLAAKLGLIATTPTIDEILDRIERRSKGRLSGDNRRRPRDRYGHELPSAEGAGTSGGRSGIRPGIRDGATASGWPALCSRWAQPRGHRHGRSTIRVGE